MSTYTEESILMIEKGALSCKEFEELLCDYADNELPKTLKVFMDSHADRCPCCQESRRTYLLTVRLANSLGIDDKLPKEVEDRLRDKLNERLGLSLKPVDVTLN